VSIKANVAASDFPLTASSNMLSCPGYDSKVVERLKSAGCIIIGQTNMDEFGMGSLGTLSNRGIVRNPYDCDGACVSNHILSNQNDKNDDATIQQLIHIIRDSTYQQNRNDIMDNKLFKATGGSSSGSAVSVAIGASILSIGTDTGGSIRLPSAWCGIVGLKPTYGSISRYGLVSYASSLDTVGIMGRTVQCASLGWDVLMNAPDANDSNIHFEKNISDSTSYYHVKRNTSMTRQWYTKHDTKSSKSLEGTIIGIPEAFSVQGIAPDILHQWEKTCIILKEQGATMKRIPSTLISPQIVKMCLPAYYVLTCAEASSNLARYDGLRYGNNVLEKIIYEKGYEESREERYSNTRRLFGKEVQRRILAGTAVLSSDRFHSHYEAALKCRAKITLQFNQAFKHECDAILIPTSVGHPPVLKNGGSVSTLDEGYAVDGTEAFKNDIMTVPISLAGLPSLSVPIKVNLESSSKSHGVVGMQIVGPPMSEDCLFQIARVMEQNV
jgi:aspartyl-tRNA(Asn)/glutamyl-tRNA(Gln) amidotransferase subunit A